MKSNTQQMTQKPTYESLENQIADLKKQNEILELNLIAQNEEKGKGATAKIVAQTRENYETFFNAIDDFLFVLDQQGNILHSNSTVLNRLGYTEEELLGQSVLMVHPPERRAEAGRIVGEMLSGITAFCPVPIITKTGIQIPVETRVFSGFWNGEPAIFGLTKDISRISLSEEKFSKLFHINPFACGLTDMKKHAYTEVNEAFYALFGFEKNEVIGHTAFDLGLFSLETAKEIMLNADSSGKVTNVETFLKTKTGQIKQVLLSAVNIYVQDNEMRYTVVHDITEVKQAERALRDSEEKHRLLVENSHDIIYTLTQGGDLMFVSPAWTALLGYPVEDVIGKPFSLFVHPDDSPAYLVFLQNVIVTGQPQEGIEYRVQHLNGTWCWHTSSAVPLRDEIGTVVGLEGIGRDITQHKKSELIINQQHEELIKLNADKDLFMSIIAHDLRSPFSSILGYSEFALQNFEKNDLSQMHLYLTILRASSLKAFELVNNLLDWARSQTGRIKFTPQRCSLRDIIVENISYANGIAMKKFIEISLNMHKDYNVWCDKNMIDTVLRNLIMNAIKFTENGGRIIIITEEFNNQILVTVNDNGIGIKPSTLVKIFDMTQKVTTPGTENETGTGLGLLLCKEFIDKHSCKIWVESEVGIGSDFKFTMTLCND